LLATGSQDKTLRLYQLDQENGEAANPFVSISNQHQGVITSIIQMPKQRDMLLTGCADKKIRLYSLNGIFNDMDGPLTTFDQIDTGVQQLCQFSDSTFLSSGYDNSVRLWDLR
jgi:WD40 repeat protein